MGQAKIKRQNKVPTVYHHTSTLRTNLIWMSGQINVEGNSKGVLHPQLGEIHTDAQLRRSFKDFPALAWFTTEINVPNCLIQSSIFFVDKKTGEHREIKLNTSEAHLLTLHRLALGFPIAGSPLVPWRDYYGYHTIEGMELSNSAIEAGDDPDKWWVSETPFDVMKISECWLSKSMLKPKMTRIDSYLDDIRSMVTMCKEKKVFIPPSWLSTEQARQLQLTMDIPILNLRE